MVNAQRSLGSPDSPDSRDSRDSRDSLGAQGQSLDTDACLGKSDLENAMREPHKYTNLIVRVGGFSARFVELEREVQLEILNRTIY